MNTDTVLVLRAINFLLLVAASAGGTVFAAHVFPGLTQFVRTIFGLLAGGAIGTSAIAWMAGNKGLQVNVGVYTSAAIVGVILTGVLIWS